MAKIMSPDYYLALTEVRAILKEFTFEDGAINCNADEILKRIDDLEKGGK